MFSILYEKSLVAYKAFHHGSMEASSAPFSHTAPPVILFSHPRSVGLIIGPLMGWLVLGPVSFAHTAPFA